MTKMMAVALCGLMAAAGPVAAQGVPVIDLSSIAQQLQQLEQMRSQLTALNQQITQAQKMFDSVNQLTNMGDVASALNNPSIRKALPADFTKLESALMGTGSGAFGTSADALRSSNEVYSRPGDDFYATELKRTQGLNAGSMSVGQGMYEAATARIDGLEQLRQQIGQADSAATKADLGNRIAVETAMLNTDMLRMQAVAMIQRAQIQVQEQRSKERYDQLVDQGIQSLSGAAASGTPSQ
jgi:type IV secretion system protein VirB5